MNAISSPSPRSKVSAIAAISATDRGLGKNNNLIWKIPDDMRRFKELTMGHPIITGRKNLEAMGRALPGRTTIVVTRDTNYQFPGSIVAHSIEEALEKAKKSPGSDEICIIGGGEIYKAALPYTDRLYLTIIDGEKDADVFFPDYSEFTKIISEEKREHEGTPYTYLTLEK